MDIDAPNDDDQDMKISAFKSYMFSEAKKTTTPELLGKIIDIINTTYLDEVRLKNEKENEEEAEIETDFNEEVNETSTCNQSKITEKDKENNQNEDTSNKHVYDLLLKC